MTPSKKPRKTAAPAKLSPTEYKYQAFLALWTTYLHLRAWGLPDYEELSPGDKEYFRGLVAKGRDAVFSHVEDTKRAVLAAGLGSQVHDDCLNFLGAASFDPVKGLPQALRDQLGTIMYPMYALLVRLDPDSMPAVGSAPNGKAPDDLITTEVAISEYETSRITIRRKVKEGMLHDHRPPGSPANSKLLLSRAELGRVFARKK